eukprot:1020647-Karenia_brevis.AAC.1
MPRTLPGEAVCFWCSPARLRGAEENPASRRRLQQSLNAFQQNQEVHAAALSRLTPTSQKAL